ncbi:hypothetical protein NPIL_25501 [Nephila pilipes]|uniref:Uncharacterized protein n=1 Tax=Nephila pilipes TaxID=299642 RepID=A0A8X6UUJ0_NEPPI|nr:hypothetical protein NPIL_25501 [Nephila pilipes]
MVTGHSGSFRGRHGLFQRDFSNPWTGNEVLLRSPGARSATGRFSWAEEVKRTGDYVKGRAMISSVPAFSFGFRGAVCI